MADIDIAALREPSVATITLPAYPWRARLLMAYAILRGRDLRLMNQLIQITPEHTAPAGEEAAGE